MGIINYALQMSVAKGFMPVAGPELCKHFVFEGCGFQPRGVNNQIYNIEKRKEQEEESSLCLVGTAEIPLAGLHMEKVLDYEELPIKMVSFGRCFRAEGGSLGEMEKGLYRVHQFSKVELFGIVSAEKSSDGEYKSEKMLKEILDLEMSLFSGLGLHYRVLDMPTEELGAPAHRKFDIEAYLPGRGAYGEISSASNCLDYQSRRLLTRYRDKHAKKNLYVHTVNGTAAAVPRLIIALLETHQQKDGSVLIPKALQPFMGGKKEIKPF